VIPTWETKTKIYPKSIHILLDIISSHRIISPQINPRSQSSSGDCAPPKRLSKPWISGTERTELSRYLIITWGSESTCQRPKLLLLRIVLHLLPEISGQRRYHNLSHTSRWGSEKSQHSKQKTLNRYFSGSGTISLLQGSLISNRCPKVIRWRRPPIRKRYQIIQDPQDLIIRGHLLGLTLITWDSREKNLSN